MRFSDDTGVTASAAYPYICTLPGGAYMNTSADTWVTLATRASRFTTKTVTAADLILANVGSETKAKELEWAYGVGATMVAAGGYAFPAWLKIKLPAGLTVPQDACVIGTYPGGPGDAVARKPILKSLATVLGVLGGSAGAIVGGPSGVLVGGLGGAALGKLLDSRDASKKVS